MGSAISTILAPSLRWSETHRKRHKTLTDWARQAILQTAQTLVAPPPSYRRRRRQLFGTGPACCCVPPCLCDHPAAAGCQFFKPAPKPRKGQRGRPPLKGLRLPKLSAVLANKKTVWTSVVVSQWYNAQRRKLAVATGTAVWYHAGIPPVPIRWVLVRDPSGEHEPSAFLSTDLAATPAMILGWFVSRWRVRNHLPRGARPSWRRDAATVVRSRHSPHHPSFAGIVPR